jgi:hypothetical protein
MISSVVLSTTGLLDLVSLLFKPGHKPVALITLNFNDAILDGASGATQLLQSAAHTLQLKLRQLQPCHQRYTLSFATLGLTADADNAVATGRSDAFPATLADMQRAAAGGAQTALICRIYRSGIAHAVSSERHHGLAANYPATHPADKQEVPDFMAPAA